VNGYRADLTALSDLVARLEAFDVRAESLATDLDAQVRRLHGEWSGPSADAHQVAHREWLSGARQLRAAAGELRSAVATARTNYAAAMSANARMWS
jgi:WXG100 family type VII secretion target